MRPDDEPQVKIATVVGPVGRQFSCQRPLCLGPRAGLSAPACLRRQLLQPGERPACGETVPGMASRRVRSCRGYSAERSFHKRMALLLALMWQKCIRKNVTTSRDGRI